MDLHLGHQHVEQACLIRYNQNAILFLFSAIPLDLLIGLVVLSLHENLMGLMAFRPTLSQKCNASLIIQSV